MEKRSCRHWNEDEIKLLKKIYLVSSWDGILSKINHSKSSISVKANKLGLYRRKCKYNEAFEMTPEIQEIVDGLLISDGSLFCKSKISGYLSITQREDRIGWLKQIKKELEEFGLLFSKWSFRGGTGYASTLGNKYVTLYTNSYPEFKNQYRRWYPNGKKIIPRDIVFTDKLLAYWFLGDGSWGTHGTSGNGITHFKIELATLGFTKEDNQFLIDSLNKQCNYRFCLIKKTMNNKLYYYIALYYEKQIIDFLQRTKPFKVKCFDYKWEPLEYILSHPPSKEILYWTKAEEQILREKYPTQSVEIPELFTKFTKKQILHKAFRMKIKLSVNKNKSSWNKDLHGKEYLSHFKGDDYPWDHWHDKK